jgi:DNA-directed RNA polymerase subunit M/transcription elongation factor TFIIS
MPIRVECDECGAELRLGDDAAGRRVKCRECGAGVQVPDARPRRKKKPARRKKSAVKKGEEEDVSFEDLDFGSLAKLEKKGRGLGQGEIIECPECGETVAENIEECPYCGEIVSERVKSERREKKRKELLGEQPNMTVHYIVIAIFLLAVGGVVAYIVSNME